MKAAVCTKYGPPEVLEIREVPKPVPGDKEILVKIMASPVNSADVRVRGLAIEGPMRIVMRFVLGFTKPRKPILGTAFSGVVAQVGKGVSEFEAGDEIYGLTGFKFGAHAEYMALPEKSIMGKKPANASFEEAAALPFGGQTAIYFLQKAKIRDKPNAKVLIYGATGAVGTAAIQIAKHFQADVTAVCSHKGEELVRKLGVKNVILYDREDFTKYPDTFDIIFDAVDKVSKKQCKHLLKKGGVFVTVGGLDVAAERREQLELLRELFEKGAYKANIDRLFTLDEVVAAHRYVDSGRKKGNVILKIA